MASSGYTLVTMQTSRGRDANLLYMQPKKPKKNQKNKLKKDDDEEKETSEGEEELDEDINKDRKEEPLTKIT